MDTGRLNKLSKLAIQKMDKCDFNGALNIAHQIQSLGPHWLISFVASGLLVDVGHALKNEKIVREGIEFLLKDIEVIVRHEKYAQPAYYNLANAYSALFDFKKMKNSCVACFRKTELEQAKIYYRTALEYGVKDNELMARILVNLGNCFDNLGRVIDALECYDKSLELKPDHGMALGNKGQALLHYAVLCGEHQGTFVIEAYSLLSQALKSGVPPEAASLFLQYLERIRRTYPGEQFLENPPKYPGYRIKARSRFERFLVDFCLRNKLYLNICNFCQKCDAAVGDKAVIKQMFVPLNKDSYFASSAYLNQIKQDYVTARFLLVLSQYEGLNLNFVDKRVRIIDTLDHSIHNIYIQLVKTSFRVLYDILDKIAFFINDYLRLDIPEKNINFRQIWYTKNKAVRKEINDTRNLSLNALFDIYRDFENGPYEKLRNTRNALTHRFVNIRLLQELEDDENMTGNTLTERALELARIVRSSIIYLLHFVYVEETRKEARTKRIALPRFAHDLPDNLKTSRRDSRNSGKAKASL